MSRKNIVIFLFLTFLVFFVNRQSLGLSLYADDWIIIAKFYNTFGPGKIFPYWRLDTWFADYGFQNITPVLFAIFKFNALPYFIINLLLKGLAAFGIYLFAKNTVNPKVGFLSGVLYATSSLALESTDWVYNMNTFLGIFIVLIGLDYLINKTGLRYKLTGWLLALLGYTIGSIRLFSVPPLLPIIEIVRGFFPGTKLTKQHITTVARDAALSLGFVLVLKTLFPYLGRWDAAREPFAAGIAVARGALEAGRYDILLSPVVNIGNMLVPHGMVELATMGVRIYPFTHFLFYGFFLGLAGLLLMVLALSRKPTFHTFLNSGLYIAFILLSLKALTKYPGVLNLQEFYVFSWAYFGLIVGSIFIVQLIKMFDERNVKLFLFYLTSFVMTVTFLVPQLVNPVIIFGPIHRYLSFPAVGMALFLGSSLAPKATEVTSLRWGKILLLALVIILNLLKVDKFYSYQLSVRNPALEQRLFSQIQTLVPTLPYDAPVVFYFNYPNPQTYHDLLLSSFGFHMQLLYGNPYDEARVASTANTYETLKAMVEQRQAPLDHVYALIWENDKFVDKSTEIRKRLQRDLYIND